MGGGVVVGPDGDERRPVRLAGRRSEVELQPVPPRARKKELVIKGPAGVQRQRTRRERVLRFTGDALRPDQLTRYV